MGSKTMTNKFYRADLDGLRAIAVIGVVLFHYELTFIQGGFLGVDVFFVISGYLIAKIIPNYTLREFYIKRVRRLMPASLTTISFIMVTFHFIAYDNLVRTIAPEARDVLLFIYNHKLSTVEKGYFYKQVAAPFLHFWTLCVEEQFYLTFPIVDRALNYRFPDKRRLVMVFLFTVSISLSMLFTYGLDGLYRNDAFYFMTLRAWELLTGVIVAQYDMNVNDKFKEPMSFVGLVAILGSLITFSGKEFITPGIPVLVVVISTALIIIGKSRLLSWEPLVWIGKRSYSIYLWHWPVFVIFSTSENYLVSTEIIFLSIVVTVLASLFSYDYIEVPFRSTKQYRHRTVLKGCFALWLMLLIFSTSRKYYSIPEIHEGEGLWKILDSDTSPNIVPNGLTFNYDHGDRMDYMFVGNSKCGQLLKILEAHAGGSNKSIGFACKSSNDIEEPFASERIVTMSKWKPKNVIWASWWSNYNYDIMESEIGRFFSSFAEGPERIILLGDCPTIPIGSEGSDIKLQLINMFKLVGGSPILVDSMAPVNYENFIQKERMTQSMSRVYENTTYIPIYDMFVSGNHVTIRDNNTGNLLYNDVIHLSHLGAERVLGRLIERGIL